MDVHVDAEASLGKAARSQAGAESELAAGRYDNCANRAYHACYQAAVAALLRAGLRPRRADDRWGHAYVQASFAGQLVNRRKRYPTALGTVLVQNARLRQIADYETGDVSQVQASRAVRRARELLDAVRAAGGV